MSRIAQSCLLCLSLTSSLFADVEVGSGIGYTQFEFSDNRTAQYILRHSTYSGLIYHGYAGVGFSLVGTARLNLNGVFETSAMDNTVIRNTASYSYDIRLYRVAGQGKLSAPLSSFLSGFIKLDLGYETWQINSTGTRNFEIGTFIGFYGAFTFGIDVVVHQKLKVIFESGALLGFQSARFVDPSSSAASPEYYDLTSHTYGVQIKGGIAYNFGS